MAVNLAPQPRLQYVDANGNPYSGAKLFTYLSGTTTKSATYTSQAQTTPHANPIILDASGRPPSEIWLVDGITYTFVLAPSTDTDPPVSPILTDNDIEGINAASSTTNSEWIAGPTATYISASSFSVAGDQTLIYAAGRRLKCTLSASTVYATIASSVYGSVTTVTILVDNGGAIDNTLSAVDYGILYPSSTSIPQLLIDQHLDGLINGFVDFTVAANALTLTLRPNNDQNGNPTAGNPVYARFRNSSLTNGSSVLRAITSALTFTVSSGSKLGTQSSALQRIWALLIDTGAGVVLGAYNAVDKTNLSAISEIKCLIRDGIISTIAEGGAGAADSAGVVYSDAAQTNKPYMLAGYAEISEGTAGTWATAPALIARAPTQNMGTVMGISSVADSSVQTGTTVIPLDDTGPLNSEGDLYLTCTYTPQSAANVLKFTFKLMLTSSVINTMIIAAFSSGGASASFVSAQKNSTAGGVVIVGGHFLLRADLFSYMDFRAGGAVAGTTTLNGSAGARLFSTDDKSFIEIEEIFV